MFKLSSVVVVLLISMSLSSCITAPVEWQAKGKPAINEINTSMAAAANNDQKINQGQSTALSQDVTNVLLPNLDVQSPNDQPLSRFNVSVEAVPANAFFMSLVKDSPYNVVVDPAIQDTISIQLKQVTIPEVLEALEEAYGYQYQVKKFGIYITKGKIETRTFKLHYINLERSGKSSTEISSGQLTSSDGASSGGVASSASSVSTTSNSTFWPTLSATIKALVGDVPGTSVVVNPDAGLVIVKANTAMLRQVAKYLDNVQSIMTQQVIIEAKILEVRLIKAYQAGVDWTALGLSQDGSQSFASSTLGVFNTMFTMSATAGSQFSAVINLLSSQGNVQVLSSPRIATLNNQKAIIKVGEDQFYITNVSNTTSSSSDSSENTQDVELTPFFSGIALDVTPEISGSKDIILHIHPIVSSVRDNTIHYTINGEAQEIPSAASEIKETDNIVSAKNGQIVVIGGLMENQTREYTASTPFAEKIPFIGSLFSRTSQESINSELIILLKPVIANSSQWAPQLQSISERFKELKRGYHYGPYPDRFGNEAEYPPKKSN
jgi:MSHA biogenesis protein MshL